MILKSRYKGPLVHIVREDACAPSEIECWPWWGKDAGIGLVWRVKLRRGHEFMHEHELEKSELVTMVQDVSPMTPTLNHAPQAWRAMCFVGGKGCWN